MWQTMWQFKTARFTISWDITPDDSPDLSWCETGETAENIDSGLWQAFDSRVVVLVDGLEIGADYLGQSIYENVADFRDHIGSNRQGYGSYFSDMIRQAIEQARHSLDNMPNLRPISR